MENNSKPMDSRVEIDSFEVIIANYKKSIKSIQGVLIKSIEQLLKSGDIYSASRLLAEISPCDQPERLVKRCKATDASFSLSRSLVERGLMANIYKKIYKKPLPEWQINTKISGNEFVKGLGYDVPKVIERGIPAGEISILPNTVIKPSSGGNSQGVFSIDQNQKIFDVGANEEVSKEVAIERIMRHETKFGDKGIKWNIEERISGPGGLNPVDLKFYAFYGKVGVATEVQRQPFKAFNNYLRNGEKVSTGKYDGMTFSGTPPSEEEIAIAEAISKAVPVPYLRIDFMRAADGRLLFCEFTPRPGNFDKHNSEIDQLCGRMYVEAECRILNNFYNQRSALGYSG